VEKTPDFLGKFLPKNQIFLLKDVKKVKLSLQCYFTWNFTPESEISIFRGQKYLFVPLKWSVSKLIHQFSKIFYRFQKYFTGCNKIFQKYFTGCTKNILFS